MGGQICPTKEIGYIFAFYAIKMPQSGVGSMRGSKERTHTRGGCTHNVTQQTDTHIFKGGGRTHNVTQRTDTHIFKGGGDAPTM